MGCRENESPRLWSDVTFCSACLEFNIPRLYHIQNIQEELDPSLAPILNKAFTKTGGILMIKLGDKDIEYNPSFRYGQGVLTFIRFSIGFFYTQKRLPSVHNWPQNFHVSHKSLLCIPSVQQVFSHFFIVFHDSGTLKFQRFLRAQRFFCMSHNPVFSNVCHTT